MHPINRIFTILALSVFSMLNGQAQTLENIEWLACNIYEDTTYILWTNDTVYFKAPAVAGFETFKGLSVYALSGDTLFWTDLENSNQCDPAILGTYLYEITDNQLDLTVIEDGCGFRVDVLNNILLKGDVPAAIQALELKALQVFPNPVAAGPLQLDVPALDAGASYQVYDTNGRLVMRGLVGPDAQIDVSALPAGLYRLQLRSDALQWIALTTLVKL